ncbi:MAG TPA: VCBS repeat-containing protein [Steroidobacteraceae bacterium]|nr:VCBS repeat-containing protein [Steroidobacteraceae bacterium]
MTSPFARCSARLLLVLPALALASCGGSGVGTLITVPNSVVVGDFNGDGVVDVAVARAQIDETGITQKPGLLSIILNTKSKPGTFLAAVNYNASSSPPSGLAVGDLTGNGSHDMVVANLNAGTLSVFMETSPTSGTYGAATTISVGGQPNDVQIADLDGDGLPDLIVADNLGKVTYLIQNHAKPGTFNAGVSLPITNRGIAVAVGDLNGDGLPDLAVTSFDAYGDGGQVTIYFQDSNPANRGTFVTATGTALSPLTIAAPGEPSQIRIADLRNAGTNDIVVALQGLGANSATDTTEAANGAMVILQNLGAPGTFAAPVVYPGASGTISLAIGDLNNDGLPDIAMCSLYPQGQGFIVTLMQVAGAPGTFGTATSYAGQGQPVSIAIADVNDDGLPDLVTADGTLAVWLANQTATPGTFLTQGEIGL